MRRSTRNPQWLKIAAPAAVVAGALAYLVARGGGVDPWQRPEGLGIKPATADAGAPWRPTGFSVRPSPHGAPVTLQNIEARMAATPARFAASADVRPDPAQSLHAAYAAGGIAPLPAGVTGGPPRGGAEVRPEPTGAMARAEFGRPDVAPAPTGAVARAEFGRMAAAPASAGAPSTEPAGLPPAQAEWPGHPNVEEVAQPGDFIHRMLLSAKAGEWADVAAEVERFGGAAASVAEPPAECIAVPGPHRLGYAGVLTPSDDPAALDEELKKFLRPGAAPPIVLVTGLGDGWQRVYDRVFDAFAGGDAPLAGLCIGRMTEGELMRLPEFARRYAGHCAGFVANYDLSTVNLGLSPLKTDVEKAARRVALTLELLHRASPGSEVWLASGYTGRPLWSDWVRAQAPERYTGILMIGHTAASLCGDPASARAMCGPVCRLEPKKPIGVAGVSGKALRAYADLLDRLSACGLSLVHIQEEERP